MEIDVCQDVDISPMSGLSEKRLFGMFLYYNKKWGMLYTGPNDLQVLNDRVPNLMLHSEKYKT